MEKANDDKDIFAELVKSVIVSEKLLILLLGYLVSEERLAYDEEWDKTAELQSELEEESDNFQLF